jgi:hypothetical protein
VQVERELGEANRKPRGRALEIEFHSDLINVLYAVQFAAAAARRGGAVNAGEEGR